VKRFLTLTNIGFKFFKFHKKILIVVGTLVIMDSNRTSVLKQRYFLGKVFWNGNVEIQMQFEVGNHICGMEMFDLNNHN